MSRDGRKPWEIPIQYTEDRFPEKLKKDNGVAAQDEPEERDARDVESILRRPDRVRDERHYECTDTTPINYERGQHDSELDVDDRDERPPAQYERGAEAEEDFGFDEEEDLEPLGGEAEFPEL